MKFTELWAHYRATRGSTPADDWAARLHAALVAEWHDVDDCSAADGGGHPILWYDQKRHAGTWRWRPYYSAISEPCIFCGKVHTHGAGYDGNGDGHRAPHLVLVRSAAATPHRATGPGFNWPP
jgi:hypothetical protein